MCTFVEVLPLGTAERIFDLVDAKYKEQRDFAKAIGVSASMVSQWRMGITKSYTRRLPQIAEALGTTTEYLLTGKKEPAGQQADGKQEEFIQLYQQLTPQEQAFFLSQLRGYVKDRGTSSAPQE